MRKLKTTYLFTQAETVWIYKWIMNTTCTKYEYFGWILMRQFAIRDPMTKKLFTDIDNKRPSIMKKITKKPI